MSRVTLDGELKNRLNGLDEVLEFYDENGVRMGHFLPSGLCDDLRYAALAAESPHSQEELKQRHQEQGGRSLSEIWKRLGLAEVRQMWSKVPGSMSDAVVEERDAKP